MSYYWLFYSSWFWENIYLKQKTRSDFIHLFAQEQTRQENWNMSVRLRLIAFHYGFLQMFQKLLNLGDHSRPIRFLILKKRPTVLSLSNLQELEIIFISRIPESTAFKFFKNKGQGNSVYCCCFLFSNSLRSSYAEYLQTVRISIIIIKILKKKRIIQYFAYELNCN